jgi:hypothetical protein
VTGIGHLDSVPPIDTIKKLGGIMNGWLISLVIGVAAGAIDILPMVLQKMAKRAIVSAFLQYFFVAIVIVNISLPGIPWWLQGGIVSLALSLPIIAIVTEKDKKAGPIIAAMAVFLGTLIGVAGHFLK